MAAGVLATLASLLVVHVVSCSHAFSLTHYTSARGHHWQEFKERLDREEAGRATAAEGLGKARAKVSELEAEMRDVEGARERKLKVRSDSSWCCRR